MEVLIFCYQRKENRGRTRTDALIQQSVVRYCDKTGRPCPEGLPAVLRMASGKPYLENPHLFVGVTHTEKWTFVGVSQTEFGLDGESLHREIRQKERLLTRFFSADEQAEVLALPTALQKEKILRFWVKKEAMLKYSGVGISGLSDSDTQKASGFFTDFSFDDVAGCLYALEPVTYQVIENDFSATGQNKM